MTIISTDKISPKSTGGDRLQRRFACVEGAATLYKFTAFDTPERREWVAQILSPPHRIYLAAPSQLNDEFDLRPLVRLPPGVGERELRARLTADAEQQWSRRPPTAADVTRYRARLRTIDLDQFAREAADRVRDRLETNYGVFSLARERGLTELWDEYADSRRGLCIHFRADALSPFGYAQRVIYQAQRPILYLPLPGERVVADRALLTKTATRWEKEREYRLLRFPEAVYEGLRVDGRYGYFSADTITGITVGTEMPQRDVEIISGFALQFKAPLRVDRPRLVALPDDPPLEGSAGAPRS